MPIAALTPLTHLPGVRLYSLQVGARAADLAQLPAGSIADLAPLLTDFAETAAALSALDLVIAVDTSVVHLAGALGRPTWLLLSTVSEWRWLQGRDDTPWYPTVRLFRQERYRDWTGLMSRVTDALTTLRAGDGGPS
jgi:ADP-heptose:LPS heptosyltransferase